MTVRRLVATCVIFLGASLAWATLGSSLLARAGGFDGRLEQEVEALWGRPQHQAGPIVQILRPGNQTELVETTRDGAAPIRKEVTRSVVREIPLPVERTRAHVDLGLAQRRRGLLWYPTYTVAFDATTSSATDAETRTLGFDSRCLPRMQAAARRFVFSVGLDSTDAVRGRGPGNRRRDAGSRRRHRHAPRQLPVARNAPVDLRLRAIRRHGGPAVRARDANQFSRRGLPCRHPVSRHRHTACRRR